MAQADGAIANQSGAAFRADLNNQLAALFTNHSGASAPSTTYAYQWWPDTTTGLLKIRNAANNGWVTIGTLADTGFGLLSRAGGTVTGAVQFDADVTIADRIIHAGDTNTQIRFPAADTISFETNGSERGRIDSSGRVLVGTTAGQGTNALQIEQSAGGFVSLRRAEAATAITDGEDLGGIEFQDNAGNVYARILGEADGTAGANDFPGRITFSTTIDAGSSPTERVRITNGGSVFFGVTANPSGASGGSGFVVESNGRRTLYTATTTTAEASLAAFFNPNGQVGSINTSGTSTIFATSSDYRLKENLVSLDGAIDRLKGLPVHRFNFIADPSKTVDGFLAHEVADVVPEAVIGKKDAVDDNGSPVYQGIDQSKLVPLLTAALQDAISRIEALEVRVASI